MPNNINLSLLMAGDDTKQTLLQWGFFLLLVASFYNQSNVGGIGLKLTYNIPVWIVAGWIVAVGLLLVSARQSFIYFKGWLYFIFFPCVVITHAFWVEIGLSNVWFFRQLYILGGFFFLFALFQFSANQRTIDKILYMLVLAMGGHALLGALQAEGVTIFHQLLPDEKIRPKGNFQQINVQATFLVTGLMSTFYLISLPSFRTSGKIKQATIVISFALGVYVAILSGSLTGLLSLIIGTLVILSSRYRQLRYHKKLMVILLMVSIVSIYAGISGLYKTAGKIANLSEPSSVARVAMYHMSMEMIAQKPIRGYGIGGFLKAWNEHSYDFAKRYPDAPIPTDRMVGHPHNELLFWAIESGLFAVIAILFIAAAIILALRRYGWQRSGAYFAMLLPISFHTQVELPFYMSAMHWFLWLFLVYLVLRHQARTITFNMSMAATRLLQLVAFVIGSVITVFMINTARAQNDLYLFLYEPEKAEKPYLQRALNNLYFRSSAEPVAKRSNLYVSIERGERDKVAEFERWAQHYIEASPQLKIYEDLISASVFLRPEGEGCDMITAGLRMYPYNQALKEAYADKCARKQ